MAGITLTGMASGLDTDVHHLPADGAGAEQGHGRPDAPGQGPGPQGRPVLDQDQARRFKTAAPRSATPRRGRRRRRPARRTSPSSTSTLLSGAGIGGHTVQIDKLASSAQHGFTYTPSATAGTLDLYYAPTAARSDADEGHDRRRRQRDRVRHRDADQRQRERAGVRRGGQGRRQQRAHRLLLAQDRPGLGLHGRHDRAGRRQLARRGRAPTRAPAPTLTRRTSSTARSRPAHVAVQHHRERDPGRPPDAEGRHHEPDVGHHDRRPRSTPTPSTKKVQALVDAYNAVVTATRAELTEKSDPKATTTAASRRARCSATPA